VIAREPGLRRAAAFNLNSVDSDSEDGLLTGSPAEPLPHWHGVCCGLRRVAAAASQCSPHLIARLGRRLVTPSPGPGPAAAGRNS
jgi:hypothetical protein